jgi:hypothetical protein
MNKQTKYVNYSFKISGNQENLLRIYKENKINVSLIGQAGLIIMLKAIEELRGDFPNNNDKFLKIIQKPQFPYQLEYIFGLLPSPFREVWYKKILNGKEMKGGK